MFMSMTTRRTRLRSVPIRFVADNFGATDSTPLGLFLEEVRNVLPGNLSVNLSINVINENDIVDLSGTFSDVGLLDSHAVSIEWGDGSPRTELVLPPNGGVLRSLPLTQHQYVDDPASGPDTYTITVELTDDDEPLTPVTLTRVVTVNNVAPQNVQIAAQFHRGVRRCGDRHFVRRSGIFDTHRVTVDWGDGRDADQQRRPVGRSSSSAATMMTHSRTMLTSWRKSLSLAMRASIFSLTTATPADRPRR
jgi:hypothetical protein